MAVIKKRFRNDTVSSFKQTIYKNDMLTRLDSTRQDVSIWTPSEKQQYEMNKIALSRHKVIIENLQSAMVNPDQKLLNHIKRGSTDPNYPEKLLNQLLHRYLSIEKSIIEYESKMTSREKPTEKSTDSVEYVRLT